MRGDSAIAPAVVRPIQTPGLSESEVDAIHILRQTGHVGMQSRVYNRTDFVEGLHKFQEAHGLAKSDTINPETRSKLIEEADKIVGENKWHTTVQKAGENLRKAEAIEKGHINPKDTQDAKLKAAEGELTNSAADVIRAMYPNDKEALKGMSNEQLVTKIGKMHLAGFQRDAQGNEPGSDVDKHTADSLKRRADAERGPDGKLRPELQAALEKFESAYAAREKTKTDSPVAPTTSLPLDEKQLHQKALMETHDAKYGKTYDNLTAQGASPSDALKLVVREFQRDLQMGTLQPDDLQSPAGPHSYKRNAHGQAIEQLRQNGFKPTPGEFDAQTLDALRIVSEARIAHLYKNAGNRPLSAEARTQKANIERSLEGLGLSSVQSNMSVSANSSSTPAAESV
ncbi:MAG: hypothetical protein IT290_01510 [Deltaproteobacteria bacterium]|nr:hypothetical protein [Deltaproteobacteria bacterium]